MGRLSSTDTVYGVGCEGVLGLEHGPTPYLDEMLDVFAGDEAAVIWRFNPDDTEEIVYRWRKGRWEEVERA